MSIRSIPGLQKTTNHLSKISSYRTNGRERNIDKTMLTSSFHQLRNAAIFVHVHNNEKTGTAFDVNHFAW